jgi:hypothetical protein
LVEGIAHPTTPGRRLVVARRYLVETEQFGGGQLRRDRVERGHEFVREQIRVETAE